MPRAPANGGVVQMESKYLIDDEARDVSWLTGIPWYYARVHQRGPLHPFIDLVELQWWDRWRVAWARIGVYHLIGVL